MRRVFGCPTGQCFEPFLRVSDYIPKTTSHKVQSAIYADIALFACGPTEVGYLVRASIQTAVHAVNEYLANIGLQLSTEKTEALMVHPGATCSRFEVPPLTMRGSPFPWPKSARYLGLQIDCRLNFNSAVSHLCKESRRVASAPFSREDGVARHILR